MKVFINNLSSRDHATRLISCLGITRLPIRLTINAIKFVMYIITSNKNTSGKEIFSQKIFLSSVTKSSNW